MRALSMTGDSRLEVVDKPTPTPAHDEVVVRTVVSAVCGSEMKGFRRDGFGGGNNGHEAAGVIAAVGKEVKGWSEGDRVGVSAIVGCGKCAACAAGRYTWCDDLTFHSNMHAEYFRIPARGCHRLPDDVDWEAGVLISGDGMGVPYHSETKLRGDGPRRVAVFGLGPIGLGHVLLQNHLGREVWGVDPSPHRREIARRLGAHAVLDAGEDVPEEIRDGTGGGVDVAFESAGLPITASQALGSVRRGGVVVFNGEQPRIELSPSEDLIRRDVSAVGTWFYHFSEFGEMLAHQRQGLDVGRLITDRYELSDAEEAYRNMAEGRCGKVVLTYREAS